METEANLIIHRMDFLRCLNKAQRPTPSVNVPISWAGVLHVIKEGKREKG